jgi:hypothetical protein
MSRYPLLCCGVLAACSITSSSVRGEEQKISCEAVPQIIRAAFARTYPAASPTACTKEVARHRTTSYEITGVEGRMTRKGVFSPDGKTVTLEESIELAEVPGAVQQAIKARYPEATITAAERVTYPALEFEFFIRHRGKLMQVAVNASGNQVREVKD